MSDFLLIVIDCFDLKNFVTLADCTYFHFLLAQHCLQFSL